MSDIHSLIKSVSRGARRELGAETLTAEEAKHLMAALLAQKLSPVQLGAALMALRIKSETQNELAGFLSAVQENIRCLPAFDQAVVLMPCYNGARKLPALSLLLALLLAKQNIPVLMHGVRHFPGRVTTYEVCEAYDLTPASSMGEAFAQLSQRNLCFIPVDVLSDDLNTLLDVRLDMGLRSSAHTLVKMMSPLPSASLRLLPITHDEYRESMRQYFINHNLPAMIFRGAEGEPVPPVSRSTRIDCLPDDVLELSTSNESLPELDAQATAIWIKQIILGHSPCPVTITQFAELIKQKIISINASQII